MMTLSTLLPQDRYFLGDGEPKKYDLLLQNLFQHEKVEAVLNDFARPLGPHKEEEYLARLMNEAYAAYRADRGEAVDAAEAADEAA